MRYESDYLMLYRYLQSLYTILMHCNTSMLIKSKCHLSLTSCLKYIHVCEISYTLSICNHLDTG